MARLNQPQVCALRSARHPAADVGAQLCIAALPNARLRPGPPTSALPPAAERALCNSCATCLENLHYTCSACRGDPEASTDVCLMCVERRRAEAEVAGETPEAPWQPGEPPRAVLCPCCRQGMELQRFLDDDMVRKLSNARATFERVLASASLLAHHYDGARGLWADLSQQQPLSRAVRALGEAALAAALPAGAPAVAAAAMQAGPSRGARLVNGHAARQAAGAGAPLANGGIGALPNGMGGSHLAPGRLLPPQQEQQQLQQPDEHVALASGLAALAGTAAPAAGAGGAAAAAQPTPVVAAPCVRGSGLEARFTEEDERAMVRQHCRPWDFWSGVLVTVPAASLRPPRVGCVRVGVGVLVLHLCVPRCSHG